MVSRGMLSGLMISTFPSMKSGRIKRRALGESLVTILRSWYPRGELRGKHFEVGNISGEEGKSLKVNIELGVWKDFGEPQTKGGDIIRLNQFRLQAALKREVSPLFAAGDVSRLLVNFGLMCQL